jgi:hypothetical protein
MVVCSLAFSCLHAKGSDRAGLLQDTAFSRTGTAYPGCERGTDLLY